MADKKNIRLCASRGVEHHDTAYSGYLLIVFQNLAHRVSELGIPCSGTWYTVFRNLVHYVYDIWNTMF